jgi:hypothetical protein
MQRATLDVIGLAGFSYNFRAVQMAGKAYRGRTAAPAADSDATATGSSGSSSGESSSSGSGSGSGSGGGAGEEDIDVGAVSGPGAGPVRQRVEGARWGCAEPF